MMRKYHVPFCRAVEGATPSLTLIYRAIALNNLGNKKDARLDFQHAKKLYLGQLKPGKISTQEKNEAWVKLETVEQNLLLLKS